MVTGLELNAFFRFAAFLPTIGKMISVKSVIEIKHSGALIREKTSLIVTLQSAHRITDTL